MNLSFGITGLVVMVQFASKSAWLSFFAGWLVSVVNFELIKKIGFKLAPLYSTQAKESPVKLSQMLWVFLGMKILFWGCAIAFLVFSTTVRGIPFGIGMLSLLISSVLLVIRDGIRDVKYARA